MAAVKNSVRVNKLHPGLLLVVAVVLLAMLLFLASRIFSTEVFDSEQLALRLENEPPLLLLAYFFGAVLFTAVGLPRQLVAFVCGYVFGLWQGVLLSLLAALLGCIVAYSVANRWLGPWISKRYRKIVDMLDKLVRHDAFAKVIVIRLQPFGTNLLTNLCAGVSAIRPLTFFSATAIGYLPQLLVFALAGDGIRLGQGSKLLLSGAMLLISLVVALWLWRRHLAREAREIRESES